MFYYSSRSNALLHIDLFDCFLGFSHGCVKVLETQLARRKRGLFLASVGPLVELGLDEKDQPIIHLANGKTAPVTRFQADPTQVACSVAPNGLWSEWTRDEEHCSENCHRQELWLRHRNTTVCSKKAEGGVCREDKEKTIETKCTCMKFDDAEPTATLDQGSFDFF